MAPVNKHGIGSSVYCRLYLIINPACDLITVWEAILKRRTRERELGNLIQVYARKSEKQMIDKWMEYQKATGCFLV